MGKFYLLFIAVSMPGAVEAAHVMSVPNGPCGVDPITNVTTLCPSSSVCQPRMSELSHESSRSSSSDPLLFTCVHKPLFPLEASDIWAAVLVLACCALAAGGGVGGGGLLVPVYLVVLNFETNQATSLSLATISGGAVANLWTYAQRRHPNPFLKRPLIDYDASLLFGPPLLAGTMVGAVFSAVFPEWLVVVCLVFVLGQSARKTLSTGLVKWRQDPEAWKGSSEPNSSDKHQDAAQLLNDASDQANNSGMYDSDDDEACRRGDISIIHDGSGSYKEEERKEATLRSDISVPWHHYANSTEVVVESTDFSHSSHLMSNNSSAGSHLDAIAIDPDGQPVLESSALVNSFSSSSSSSAPNSAHKGFDSNNDNGFGRYIDRPFSYKHRDNNYSNHSRNTGSTSFSIPSPDLDLHDLDEHALELAPLGRVAANGGGGASSPMKQPSTALGRSLAVGMTKAAEQRANTVAGQYALMHDQTIDPRLRAVYHADATLVPVSKLTITGVTWVSVLVCALLRGGKGGQSWLDAPCGGGVYWGVFGLNLALLFACTVYARDLVLTRHEYKESLGHRPVVGDLRWNRNTTLEYPALSVAAGVAAGLLGIGGGMVLGPLLVALGCDPLSTAATSAFAVLLTATAGLAQVAILGLVPTDYAWCFAGIGILGTVLGQTAVDWALKKYKKDAVVILLMAAIMFVALVLMTSAGILSLMAGAPTGFGELC